MERSQRVIYMETEINNQKEEATWKLKAGMLFPWEFWSLSLHPVTVSLHWIQNHQKVGFVITAFLVVFLVTFVSHVLFLQSLFNCLFFLHLFLQFSQLLASIFAVFLTCVFFPIVTPATKLQPSLPVTRLMNWPLVVCFHLDFPSTIHFIFLW